jgi:hypothetical protein
MIWEIISIHDLALSPRFESAGEPSELKVDCLFRMRANCPDASGFVWISKKTGGYGKLHPVESEGTVFMWKRHEAKKKFYITIESGDYQGYYLTHNYDYGFGAWKLWSEAEYWNYKQEDRTLYLCSSRCSGNYLAYRKSNEYLYCHNGQGYAKLKIQLSYL